MANASFKVVGVLQSISITTAPSRTKPYYYTSEDAKSCTMPFDPTGMVVTGTYSDGSSVVIDNAKLSFSAIPAKAGSQPVTITAGENITATVNVTVSEATVVKNSTDMIGTEDNSTAFWGAHSDDFNVPAGQTKSITFTNYSSLSDNWSNFVVILRKADLTEYAVVRADNYGWGTGYGACTPNGTQGDWATWLAGMNGAKVTVYVTNCGDGTADVQAVMQGTDDAISTQCYWGINTIDANDLNFALTVDGCHLVFNN